MKGYEKGAVFIVVVAAKRSEMKYDKARRPIDITSQQPLLAIVY
jgi:hypothetical protein